MLPLLEDVREYRMFVYPVVFSYSPSFRTSTQSGMSTRKLVEEVVYLRCPRLHLWGPRMVTM